MDAKALLTERLEKRLARAKRRYERWGCRAATAQVEAAVLRKLGQETRAEGVERRRARANRKKRKWRARVDQLEEAKAMLETFAAQPFELYVP